MTKPYVHVDESLAFEPTVGYARLRGECPLHHVGDHQPPFYVVSRFDDVVATLKQPRLWGNSRGPGVFYQDSGVLGSADDPDHARQRSVLRNAFVPTAIARMEPSLTAIADQLLDEMFASVSPEPSVGAGDGAGAADFVSMFAFPFPALAIGELLGVPAEDRDLFGSWTATIVAALTGGDLAAYEAARDAMGDYVDAILLTRQASLDASHAGPAAPEIEPAAPAARDLLDMMLEARRDGRLSATEVRRLAHQLLVAGHETTTSLLGMMLYRLIEHPDVMAALRADPSLIPSAVEEALRFDSPVNGLFRTNASECAIHDETIPADSKLQILYASANRDPERFPDPDEFRLDRPREEAGKHVAFGWGIHFCIGAPLARLEARIAFERLLARTERIELAGDPTRNESFVLHGLTSLPIRWETATTSDSASTAADPATTRSATTRLATTVHGSAPLVES